MKLNQIKATVAALLVATGGLTSTFAVPTLMFSADGGAWQTFYGNPSGSVAFSGYLGGSGRWTVNLSGSVDYGIPTLDLSSVSAQSRFGGSLVIRLIETDLNLGVSDGKWINTLTANVPTRSLVSVSTYFDSNDGDFSTTYGTLLTSQSQGSTAGELIKSIVENQTDVPVPPFSLMIEVTLNHRFGGQTLFSDSLVDPPRVPDGGTTLILFGLALGGFGLFNRTCRT